MDSSEMRLGQQQFVALKLRKMSFFNFHPEGEFVLVGFLPFFRGVTPSVIEPKLGVDDHGGLFALTAQPCCMLQACSLAVLSGFR